MGVSWPCVDREARWACAPASSAKNAGSTAMHKPGFFLSVMTFATTWRLEVRKISLGDIMGAASPAVRSVLRRTQPALPIK